MWNLFKRPIEKSSLEAWAKIADDVGKVAILAIPVILYGKDPIYLKLINSILLLIGCYASFLGGRLFRKKAEEI